MRSTPKPIQQQIHTVTHKYQYAQPSANASESSINRAAYSVNEPVTGIKVAISPSDCLYSLASFQNQRMCPNYMTKKTMMPTSEKLIRAPAGPPSCSALPELTSNPGPMMPVEKISQRLQKKRTNCGRMWAGVVPPIAIICKCLDLSWRFNGAARGSFAISSSVRCLSSPVPDPMLFAVSFLTGPLYVTAVSPLSVICGYNLSYEYRTIMKSE